MEIGRLQRLTGWGQTSPTRAQVYDLHVADLPKLVSRAGRRGVIPRGLGRSYGDPAQNAGGSVVRLVPGLEPAQLDESTGNVTCHAGVSIDDLLTFLVPRGRFVPVTPGTRFVTIGGAIASDVHGKNHHVDGSWGHALLSMRMLMADGEVRDVTAGSDPGLWWSTIGGMGLTGIIVEATFRTIAISSSRCVVDTDRAADLDEMMSRMEVGDDLHRYSVAWIDLLATGSSLGRGVLTSGDHATADVAGSAGSLDRYANRRFAAVPPGIPNLLVPATVRAFNEVWFRKSPRHREGELQSIGRFFHPLDGVRRWNRLYGRPGFLQLQFVLPFGEEEALRSIVERVAQSGHASFLAVLKRFGAGNDAMLSFPKPGWTLTLDLPAGRDVLGRLLHELDETILTAGGRHYLAKDAHMSSEAMRRGYPRLDEWQEQRHKADPDGVWVSDLARRLDLV